MGSWLPDGLSVLVAILLVATTWPMAAITAAFGLGGGMTLLVVLPGAMRLSGSSGSWSGKQVLERLPESLFRTGFRVILTVLAVKLLIEALVGADDPRTR